jgi:hypothetical protein
VCTAPTINPLACTNSTTAAAPFTNNATGTNQSATTTNSGTANGFATQTTGGGDASATNSGTNLLNGMLAQTTNGGNATATNSGSDTGNNVVAQTFTTGNATANNSGTIGDISSSDFSFLQARAIGSGNATATNSGNVAGGIAAVTLGGGTATATNSGTTPSSLVAFTGAGGDATATNSGFASGIAAVAAAGGNASVTNSGVSIDNGTITGFGFSTTGGIVAIALNGNATLTNSGSSTNTAGFALLAAATGNATIINSGIANGGIDINANGVATLTNVVGGRVIGPIDIDSVTSNVVNFQGGNWLLTIGTAGPSPTFNTGGAPFVTSSTTNAKTLVTTTQVAVLDPTTFALADRSLTNFTGEISEMLQGRFGGMSTGPGGTVLGFAGGSGSAVADQAQAAFSGIPSVAMSYPLPARVRSSARRRRRQRRFTTPRSGRAVLAASASSAPMATFCRRPIAPSAAPWALIGRWAAICGSGLLSAPAPAERRSTSTCRRSTPPMCSAALTAASIGSRNTSILRSMAAASTTRARARSPTILCQAAWKPPPRAMAAGSSARK